MDNVNHPEHYTQGTIECIDAMTAAFGTEIVSEYCLINAFKYLWRHNLKENPIQDIKKARWYINKSLELKGEHDEL